MILAHGYNKMFGPGGLEGTAGWFESLGLRPARVHATVAAVLEMSVGILIVAGLATPAACAGLVGLMAVAALTDHRGKGYFVFKGGSEYVVLVAVVAIGLACLGPGKWSLDRALGFNELKGLGWGLGAAAAGAMAALGLLAASYRPKGEPESGA
jgi:putative oxidoreductase